MFQSAPTRWLILSVLIILLAFRVGRWLWGQDGLFTPDGGQRDFEIYIVPAAEMLNGKNPYRLVLDGTLSNMPGNTPLFLVAMLPYCLFNLSTAKLLWFLTNVAASVGIIALIEQKLLPNPFQIKRFFFLLILFLALAPTSSAIQIGQTPIFIFFFALLGLVLLPRSQVLSGVLFGLAFSKYTLVFLLVPYLLIDRHFYSLFIAFLTQLAGILIMSWLVSDSPFELMTDYLFLIRSFVSSPTELNLHSRLAEFGLPGTVAAILSVVGIAITLFVLIKYMTGHRTRTALKDKAILIPLLFIGAIPFVYHRLYDGVVIILLVVSWFAIVNSSSSFGLLKRWIVRFMDIGMVLVFTTLLYPRNLLEATPLLQRAGHLLTTISLLLAWLFLIYVISQPRLGETVEPSL